MLAVAVALLLADAPADPRLDPARDLLRTHVDEGKIAGAVAAVWERDRVVLHEALGTTGVVEAADGSTDRPMPLDGLFRIASMTKPVTTVTALTLVDDGTIAVDDPVAKFIPEFGSATVLAPGSDPGEAQPLDRPLTVRDLLTQTSGLTYSFWGKEPHADLLQGAVAEGLAASPLTLEESVRRLAGIPLISQPGEKWHYSLSTDVLGRVIEVADGRPLAEAMRARVLDPLQMTDTHFVIPDKKTSRLTGLFKREGGQLVAVDSEPQWEGRTVHSESYQLPNSGNRYRSGGAGLVSTAGDYLRFCRALLGGGELDGVRVLQESTVRAMTSNQIGRFSCGFPIHGDKFGYGVGIHTAASPEKNGASPGTFGWAGFFYTYFWVDPSRQVAGVLMVQLHPQDLSLWADFQNTVYDCLNAQQPAKAAAGPQPGDVYRQTRLDNDGNLDWRVTDPRSTAGGAQAFLPNPTLAIDVPTLKNATRAEVTLDRWGGHLKTSEKAIRFSSANSRSPWLVVPEAATLPSDRAEYYYVQDNPTVAIPLSMLREGPMTVDGLCSRRDGYDWGQWGLYSLILRVYYDQPAPAAAIVEPRDGDTIGGRPTIRVQSGGESVDVLAWYRGLDEDGDGVLTEWHGAHHQPTRGAAATLSGHVGRDDDGPFELTWDTEWVPDQKPRSVKLVARVRHEDGLWSVTPEVENLTLDRPSRSVRLFSPERVPEHFGVRVGQEEHCTFRVPVDPRDVDAARLSLRTWHGWDGHHAPLRFNGHLFAIDGHNHHYDHDLHPIDPTWLLRGENEFRIRSDTHHHMLEVLWPGPLLLTATAAEQPATAAEQTGPQSAGD